MNPSPWIPVVVAIVVAVLGVGGNAVLIAFFLGKLRAEQVGNAALVKAFQDFTDKTVGALLTRMNSLDEFATESSSDRAALTARLVAVERNTDGLQKMREDFASFRGESGAHYRRAEADISRLQQALDGVQRQLAQLAIHGPGQLVELTKKGGQ